MTRHDQWLTTTPEDEQDEREKRKAQEDARIERMIEAAEDSSYE